MWVRGLKLGDLTKAATSGLSHPMWVRGLKLAQTACLQTAGMVAPYVGAWIETLLWECEKAILASHPMWVRGLKLCMMM